MINEEVMKYLVGREGLLVLGGRYNQEATMFTTACLLDFHLASIYVNTIFSLLTPASEDEGTRNEKKCYLMLESKFEEFRQRQSFLRVQFTDPRFRQFISEVEANMVTTEGRGALKIIPLGAEVNWENPPRY